MPVKRAVLLANHGPAALLDQLLQIAELSFRMLIETTHSQIYADQGSRDVMVSGDPGQAVTACPIPQHARTIDLCGTASDANAFESGPPHARAHSLDN